MIRAELPRFQSDKFQTLGNLVFWNQTIKEFECATLELAWNDNKQDISCIPEGVYKVVKRYSEKFKDHWHITDVPGRELILIHSGNFYFELKGCILVGEKHVHINNDSLVDVSNSKKTLNEINKVLGNQKEFELKIYS